MEDDLCVKALAKTLRSSSEVYQRHSQKNPIHSSLYKYLPYFFKKSEILPKNAKILVQGPSSHYDEWLPILLANPSSQLTIVEKSPLLHDKLYLDLLSKRLAMRDEKLHSSIHYGGIPSEQLLKNALGGKEITTENIRKFFNEHLKIVYPDDVTDSDKDFDLMVVRMPYGYQPNFDRVRPGGFIWIVEDGALFYPLHEQAVNRFGEKNIIPLNDTPVETLNEGNSPFQVGDRGHAFIVAVPKDKTNETEIKLYTTNNLKIADYASVVGKLANKTVIFGDGKKFKLGELLGSGENSHVYELADMPGQAIRIPMKNKTSTLQFDSYYKGEKILKDNGVNVVEVKEFHPGQYIVVNKVNLGTNAETFVRNPLLQSNNQLMTEELVKFAESVDNFEYVGDFHTFQLGWDKDHNNWKLLDWSDRSVMKTDGNAKNPVIEELAFMIEEYTDLSPEEIANIEKLKLLIGERIKAYRERKIH